MQGRFSLARCGGSFARCSAGILKENITHMLQQLGKTLLRVALGVLAVLMMPLVASQVCERSHIVPDDGDPRVDCLDPACGRAALSPAKYGTWACYRDSTVKSLRPTLPARQFVEIAPSPRLTDEGYQLSSPQLCGKRFGSASTLASLESLSMDRVPKRAFRGFRRLDLKDAPLRKRRLLGNVSRVVDDNAGYMNPHPKAIANWPRPLPKRLPLHSYSKCATIPL